MQKTGSCEPMRIFMQSVTNCCRKRSAENDAGSHAECATVAFSSASENVPPPTPPANARESASLVLSTSMRQSGFGWSRSGTNTGSASVKGGCSDAAMRRPVETGWATLTLTI